MNDTQLAEILHKIKSRRKYHPDWEELIRKRVYSHVVWSDVCKSLKETDSKPTRVITFNELFDFKIRKSLIGLFLEGEDERIPAEVQEAKIDILEYDKRFFTDHDLRVWKRKNDFDEDPMAMVLYAISRDKKINCALVEHLLITLRLFRAKITQVDSSLRNLTNLKVLTLTDNWIEEIRGWNLPRGLRSLQVQCNFISSLKPLMSRPPKRLMFLGLSQNKLTDDSNFHLLAKASSCLKVLDLGDNDISELGEVVKALQSIRTLRGLVLEGNPCAVCLGYEGVILYSLPYLEYLDNVKLTHGDRLRQFSDDDENTSTGALLMYVYRIMNLEKPPKEKKVKYTFFFELEVPLLDPGLPFNEEIEVIREELAEKDEVSTEKEEALADGDGEIKSDKVGKEKKSGSEKSKKSKKSEKGIKGKKKKDKRKIGKPPSIYKFENVYEQEIQNPPRVTTFKSEVFEWGKFLFFSEPVLVIPSLKKNLKLLRDTFQSVVQVKLVCQKIRPGVIPKTKKKSKKNELEPPKPKTPPDTILAKIVLSKFTCSLENISWCDRAYDFYWAQDEPDDHPAMSCYPGSLALLNYMAETPQKAQKVKKDKKVQKVQTSQDEQKTTEDEVPLEPKPEDPIPLPKIFTIQVGFGLQRYPAYEQPVIIDPSRTAKEKKKSR